MEWNTYVHTCNIGFLTIYVFDSTPSTNSQWIFNYSQIFSIRVVTPDSQVSIINFVVQISWGRYDGIACCMWWSWGGVVVTGRCGGHWSMSLPLDPPFPRSNIGLRPLHRAFWGAADRTVNTVYCKWDKIYFPLLILSCGRWEVQQPAVQTRISCYIQ